MESSWLGGGDRHRGARSRWRVVAEPDVAPGCRGARHAGVRDPAWSARPVSTARRHGNHAQRGHALAGTRDVRPGRAGCLPRGGGVLPSRARRHHALRRAHRRRRDQRYRHRLQRPGLRRRLPRACRGGPGCGGARGDRIAGGSGRHPAGDRRRARPAQRQRNRRSRVDPRTFGFCGPAARRGGAGARPLVRSRRPGRGSRAGRAARHRVIPRRAGRAGSHPHHRRRRRPLRLGGALGDDLDAAVFRKQISLDLHDVSLADALSTIAERAGLRLTYSAAVVPLDTRVTFGAANLTVGAVLSAVLYDVGVDVLLTSRGQAALVKRGALDGFQGGTVTGRVTDSLSGQGIAVATVSVVGTSLSARSAEDGAYRIPDVPVGEHTVKVVRIGYRPVTKPVTVLPDQEATVDFALTPQATQLEEVVAIGYGTTERRELTGAVSSVTGDQVASAPVTSVDEALLGRAAGVQVVSSSGQPGAGTMVRIRGGNSISAGNDPLYVIDGVPVTTDLQAGVPGTILGEGMRGLNPISALNPNDVESIEVLKDASAGAIYGARAANGVVLITTKHGRTGQNSVSFSSYYGIQEVRSRLPLLDATQLANMVNTAYANVGQAPFYTDSANATFGRGTDWLGADFRPAPMSSYDLSVLGGDAGTRYYLSGGLLKNDGVVIGSDLNRGSFRLNLDRTVSGRFRVGSRLALSRSHALVLPNGGAASVILDALTAPPTLPVTEASGEYFTGVNPLTGRPFTNPVATANLLTNEERDTRVIGNVFAEFDIRNGLTFHSTAGGDFLNSVQDYYSPATVLPGLNTAGQGSRGESETLSWTFENTLGYQHRFGTLHSLDAVGGVTLQRTNTAQIAGSSQTFLTDALGVNGLGTAKTFVSVSTPAPHSSLLSYFARARWGVAEKSFFTLSGRVGGSCTFWQV